MEKKCWCGGKLVKSVHEQYGTCTNCGTLVYKSDIVQEKLKDFYTLDNYWNNHVVKVSGGQSIEERSEEDFNGRIQIWYDLLTSRKSNIKSLLEIGCAHGGFLSYAKSKGIQDVVGIEVDESTCQFARRKFNLPYVVPGIFPDVDLPIENFDAVVGFDVFEHFSDPVEALKKIHSILTDDGVCIFQTPSFRHENDKWLQFRPMEHLFLFNSNSITNLFEKQGFTVIEILLGINPDDMFVIAKKVQGKDSKNNNLGREARITSLEGDGSELVKVGEVSLFAKEINKIFNWIRPKKIIETGTYLGAGTTTIIAGYLKSINDKNCEFHSIEINPNFHTRAFEYLVDKELINYVYLHNGLSVPRLLLPTFEEIQQTTVDKIEFPGIFVDHNSNTRAELYHQETDFHEKEDNLLGRILKKFDYKPDFILLDSGGHMGFIEFEYVIEQLENECVIALDDVFHIKHRKSLEFIKSDNRFDIISLSMEKFGFCVAKFTPKKKNKKPVPDKSKDPVLEQDFFPQNIIAIGLVEHIGDIIACEPVSRYVRNLYPEAYIVWVTKPSYKDLLESNPYINETYTVSCLTEWIMLKNSGVFQKVFDLHIQKRVCPTCNVQLEKEEGRVDITLENYYSHGNLLSAFCQNVGLPILTDAPQVYIRDYEKESVSNLNLPKDYIVFHCLSNEYTRDWKDENWIELARSIKEKLNVQIVEVGHRSVLSKDKKLYSINLCNRLSILETAEVVNRAKIFIGIDSAVAHLANAVNTYGIILLGEYRAFKKYLPYSGNYGNGVNSEIIYSAHGPASEIPVSTVLFAVKKALRKISDLSEAKPQNLLLDFEFNQEKKSIQKILNDNPFRFISLYLPQFHPFPENDSWWGKGFTEWTNVSKAKPLFPGHYQPHLPSDLGFYDLRLEEARIAQAELAKQYGLEGFCYYHYWFNGRRLLERPFQEVLNSGKPDLPFCLAWANENWTKRWDGRDAEMLQEQVYGGSEEAVRHFKWLYRAFADKRYIRIENKPVFMIYRPSAIPDLDKVIAVWRDLARRSGLGGIFLVAMKTGFENLPNNYWVMNGFDAEVVFQPGTGEINKYNKWQTISSLGGDEHSNNQAIVIDYDTAWPIMASEVGKEDPGFACVVPSWDNTARRAKIGAWILNNSTPGGYKKWLMHEMNRVAERAHDKRVVFINAWNEWAEGNHLEPDMKNGHGYLEATSDAVTESLANLALLEIVNGDLLKAESYCKRALFKFAALEAKNYHNFLEITATDKIGYAPERKSYEKNISLIHLTLGIINRTQNKFEEALKHFKQAVFFNKENIIATICYADLCNALKLDENTIQIYQELFMLEEQSRILMTFGRLLDLVGNQNSMQFIKTALDTNTMQNFVEEIGEIELRLLQSCGPLNFGSSADIAAEVLTAVLMHMQANDFLNNGSFEEAKNCFEEAIKIMPKHSTSLAGYAITLKQLGQDVEAINSLIKAISYEPNNNTLIKILADIYFETKNYKEAINIYKQLLLVEPNNPDLLLSIANLQHTLGDFHSAENLINRTLEIDPMNITALNMKMELAQFGLN